MTTTLIYVGGPGAHWIAPDMRSLTNLRASVVRLERWHIADRRAASALRALVAYTRATTLNLCDIDLTSASRHAFSDILAAAPRLHISRADLLPSPAKPPLNDRCAQWIEIDGTSANCVLSALADLLWHNRHTHGVKAHVDGDADIDPSIAAAFGDALRHNGVLHTLIIVTADDASRWISPTLAQELTNRVAPVNPVLRNVVVRTKLKTCTSVPLFLAKPFDETYTSQWRNLHASATPDVKSALKR